MGNVLSHVIVMGVRIPYDEKEKAKICKKFHPENGDFCDFIEDYRYSPSDDNVDLFLTFDDGCSGEYCIIGELLTKVYETGMDGIMTLEITETRAKRIKHLLKAIFGIENAKIKIYAFTAVN